MTGKVTNDYGDVPRWYWEASAFLPPPRPRRRRGIGFAVVAMVLALAGCQGCPGPVPPVTPTPVVGDAALKTPATCLDVCRHESALNCAAAAPTPAGVSCVDVCVNHQNGPDPWDLDCRASAGGNVPSAGACAAIDRCN
jgi:hypothetical protein